MASLLSSWPGLSPNWLIHGVPSSLGCIGTQPVCLASSLPCPKLSGGVMLMLNPTAGCFKSTRPRVRVRWLLGLRRPPAPQCVGGSFASIPARTHAHAIRRGLRGSITTPFPFTAGLSTLPLGLFTFHSSPELDYRHSLQPPPLLPRIL